MPAPTITRWIYDFDEGAREMRDLPGGKGANVAEMPRVLGPGLVPAGFTITTGACIRYLHGAGAVPDGLVDAVDLALGRLEARVGRRLGDPGDPLLMSVRSGARDSTPGMLETILNLGLNDHSVRGLAARAGSERFAWDSYRRLVQMLGDVVRGIPGDRFEREIARIESGRGVRRDSDLDAGDLRELTHCFQAFYDFPTDGRDRLRQAIFAVFESWNGPRAVAYRRLNEVPDEWGTAVNVQQMVFGDSTPGQAPGSPSPVTRSRAVPSRAATSSSVLRVRTSCPACGRRVTCPSSTTGFPGYGRSCWRSSPGSNATSATCRTPSSPWRTGGCTCCRPAARSAMPTRPCASRSTPWTKACSRAGRRSPRSTPARSMRCCIPPSTRMPATRSQPAVSRRHRGQPPAASSSPQRTPSRRRTRASR